MGKDIGGDLKALNNDTTMQSGFCIVLYLFALRVQDFYRQFKIAGFKKYRVTIKYFDNFYYVFQNSGTRSPYVCMLDFPHTGLATMDLIVLDIFLSYT